MIVCGFMSGTSLDGLDAAVIETDGINISKVVETLYLPYPAEFQKELKSILGSRELSPDIIKVIRKLMDFHIRAFFSLKHHKYIELVGIHGQTIFHVPKQGFHPAQSWQAADPEYLQEAIQKPIVYDFRSDDIRQFGEGAPLVPIHHLALFKNHPKPLAVVNIGGVANLTWIESEDPELLQAGDTGPGNALMNDFTMLRIGQPYDENGTLAKQGNVREDILEKWLSHPYFARPFPKSLDRDTFAFVKEDLRGISIEDGLRTLLEFTAQSIIQSIPGKPEEMYISGGGSKNAFLMQRLQNLCELPVYPIEKAGFSSDFIEAEAFAYLAARVIKNLPTSFPKTTGVKHPTCGGTLLALD